MISSAARGVRQYSATCAMTCAVTCAVSFARDVHPILEENCLHCHTPPDGKGYKEVGLSIWSPGNPAAGNRLRARHRPR